MVGLKGWFEDYVYIDYNMCILYLFGSYYAIVLLCYTLSWE